MLVGIYINRLLKPIIGVQHDCGARGMGEGYVWHDITYINWQDIELSLYGTQMNYKTIMHYITQHYITLRYVTILYNTIQYSTLK